MAKYRIPMTTYVNTSVEVETDETDPEKIVEAAYEQANFPSICAQCSGWGNDQELELGDDWSPVPMSSTDPTLIVEKIDD